MKKIALAMSVSVMALAAPAMAKDGFYMGLGLAFQDNDNTVSQRAVAGGVGSPQLNLAGNRANVAALAADDVSTEAYGAFLMAGYNHSVSDMLVLGVEADASVFDGEVLDSATLPYTTQNVAPGTETVSITHRFSQQWISTIRARLGLNVTPNAMVYATGGVAFSDVELRTTFTDNWPAPNTLVAQNAQNSQLVTGYVYGGGLDWAIGGSTMLRIEFLRHDLGELQTTRALTFTSPTGPLADETLMSVVDMQTNTVRVGLAWDLNL